MVNSRRADWRHTIIRGHRCTKDRLGALLHLGNVPDTVFPMIGCPEVLK
jgi:hypothetical protein